MEGGGVVINKDTGLVCAHHFSGIVFNLCGQHDYENGTPIVFKATRIVDMVCALSVCNSKFYLLRTSLGQHFSLLLTSESDYQKLISHALL